jgi:hypothetical protein
MNADELNNLIKLREPEGLKIDFKEKFYDVNHSDPIIKNKHWNELIKDILALANGNIGTADKKGFLIIGIADKLNSHGTRDVFDIKEIPVTAKQILDKINSISKSQLPDLYVESMLFQEKNIWIIEIPPSPYLYETSKPLVTFTTIYHENSVFIRRKDGIAIASTEEREAILAEKKSIKSFINQDSSGQNQVAKENLIFLSYSRKDTSQMLKIKKYLVDIGFNVWTDEKIEPGTPVWEMAIENAITNSLAFIVLLSPASKESFWVRREIQFTETFRVPIYPILIKGDIKTSVPISLITVQRIDVTNNFAKEMQKLVIIFERQGWNTKKLELTSIGKKPEQISNLVRDDQFYYHFLKQNTRWRLLSSLDNVRFIKSSEIDRNKASAKLDMVISILSGQGIVVPNSYLLNSPVLIDNAYEIIYYSRKVSPKTFVPLRLAYFDYGRTTTNPFEIVSRMLQNEHFYLSSWSKLSEDRRQRFEWGQYIYNKKNIPKNFMTNKLEQEFAEKLYYVLKFFDKNSDSQVLAQSVSGVFSTLFESLINLDTKSFTNVYSGFSKKEKDETVIIVDLLKGLAQSGIRFNSRSELYQAINGPERFLPSNLSETEIAIIKEKTLALINTLYGFVLSIATGAEYYFYEDDDVIRILSSFAINYYQDIQFSPSKIIGSINSDLEKDFSAKNRGLRFVHNLSWEKTFEFMQSSNWRTSLKSLFDALNNYENLLINQKDNSLEKQSPDHKIKLVAFKRVYEETYTHHLGIITSFLNE